MFDVSSDAANFWFDLSNVLLVVGALIVAAATFGVFRLGSVKEHFADLRIAANEESTARANAESEKSKETAARLQKEAAQLRLDLERLKTPRTLTSAQQTALAELLAHLKGTNVDILIYGGGSDDALPLAGMLVACLEAAGWHPRIWNTISPGRWVRGIAISMRDTADQSAKLAAASLLVALQSEGLGSGMIDPFSGDQAPEAVMGPSWEPDKVAPIRVLIGSKPQ